MMRMIWAWLWADADPISRTQAIRELLRKHARENRLTVLHPASDATKTKVSEWTIHRQRLQARARKRR